MFNWTKLFFIQLFFFTGMYRDTITFIWEAAEFLVNNFEKQIFIEIQISGHMTSLVSDLSITMKPKQLKALSMRCRPYSIYTIYLIFVTPLPKKKLLRLWQLCQRKFWTSRKLGNFKKCNTHFQTIFVKVRCILGKGIFYRNVFLIKNKSRNFCKFALKKF